MEARALPGRRFDVDRPAVFLDDLVGDRKPQAGAFTDGLGGEEGGEDLLEGLRIHARPVIDHVDPHPVAVVLGDESDRPHHLHRLGGVQQEIQKDLHQLLGHAGNERQLSVAAFDGGAMAQLRVGRCARRCRAAC